MCLRVNRCAAAICGSLFFAEIVRSLRGAFLGKVTAPRVGNDEIQSSWEQRSRLEKNQREVVNRLRYVGRRRKEVDMEEGRRE